MQDMEIIDAARKTLDQGLYHGNGHITRAIDSEIIRFARDVANQTILEVVAAIKAPSGVTEKIYVADAINRAMALMR